MKLFKKVMSLLIASIMMLQVAAFAAPVPADVEGKHYEEAAKLLCALDIMVGDGTNFNGDNNITRAEFAKIMINTAGHMNIVAGYKPKGVFTDVPATDIFAPYIELGKDIGAINGVGNDQFAPNNNVTGNEAVKMMVSIIGYTLKAQEMGGYPEGFVAVAQDIGALKGIAKLDLTQPIKRGDAAILCANILKIDVMKKVSTGDEEIWESKEGVNLLAEKFDVYAVNALVSANAKTALWETSKLDAGEVELTSKGVKGVYLVGETDIDTKLGSSVKAYYKYDSEAEESTIVAYDLIDKNNNTVTTDIEDIDIGTSTNTEVQYWANEDDNKTEEVKVESIPAIIYNGAAVSGTGDLMAYLNSIDGMPGTVTFMDTDATSGAETVMITAYDTYVIDFIDMEDYIIIDEIGDYKTNATGADKIITIDVEDKNTTVSIVDKDGNELSFDALAEGNVLSVAASEAGNARRTFEVIVSEETVTGIIKVIGTDGRGNGMIKLDDGKEYMFADTYEAYVNAQGQGLKLGQGVELKLDAFGRVAAVDNTSTGVADGEYGFIIKYAISQSAYGSIEMKVFTAGGEYVTYPLASKVEIDGDKFTTDATILSGLDAAITAANTAYDSTNGYSGNAMVAPMLYKLDANGAIRYIDTPNLGAYEDEYTLGKIKGKSLAGSAMGYQSEYKGFDYTIALNSSAVIFAVPDDPADLEDDKKMRVFAASEFLTETKYNLQLLNTDRDSNVYTYGVYVTSASGTDTFQTATTESLQRQRPMFIVTKSTMMIVEDEYGDDIDTIRVYGSEEGSEKNIIIDPDYANKGQYTEGDNSVADHLFNGVTYNVAGTGSRNARLASVNGDMSSVRQASVFRPGDIFVYGTNSEGYVKYVRTILLLEEQLFLGKNSISADGRRYESTDLMIPVDIEGSSVQFADLSNSSVTSPAYFAFTVKDGAVEKRYDGVSVLEYNAALDKMVYNPDVMDAKLAYKVSKVIIYDAAATSESKRVTSGTVADLVDVTNPTKTATPCIVRVYNSGLKTVVALKNLPDTVVSVSAE